MSCRKISLAVHQPGSVEIRFKPVNLHTVKMQGPGTDVQMDVYKIKPVRSYLNEA